MSKLQDHNELKAEMWKVARTHGSKRHAYSVMGILMAAWRTSGDDVDFDKVLADWKRLEPTWFREVPL